MARGFHGRRREVEQLSTILARQRFFFARITGRRRIGKTSLLQEVLGRQGPNRRVLALQVPDAGPVGVLATVRDAAEIFGLDTDQHPLPTAFSRLAPFTGRLCRDSYTVVVDEFQNFNRRLLSPFSSHLRAEVDKLLNAAEPIRGGLVVLATRPTSGF